MPFWLFWCTTLHHCRCYRYDSAFRLPAHVTAVYRDLFPLRSPPHLPYVCYLLIGVVVTVGSPALRVTRYFAVAVVALRVTGAVRVVTLFCYRAYLPGCYRCLFCVLVDVYLFTVPRV